MAKIIAHAPDRTAALALLGRAIASTKLTGVRTNLAFHELVLSDPEFVAGGFDTGIVARVLGRHGPQLLRVLHG
jgi:acetyl/propionyl-CoA carboxylase alpha subunit